MTRFKKTDIVIAKVTAQGMTAGQIYAVADLKTTSNYFGTWTVYRLVDGEVDILVSNLHLLADAATEDQEFDLATEAFLEKYGTL